MMSNSQAAGGSSSHGPVTAQLVKQLREAEEKLLENASKDEASGAGYENTWCAFNSDLMAIRFAQGKKIWLKEIGKNVRNRQSIASYERCCASFGYAPNAMVMKVAMELEEEEKAKSK